MGSKQNKKIFFYKKKLLSYFGCRLLDFLEELDISDGDAWRRSDLLHFDFIFRINCFVIVQSTIRQN